MALTPSSVSLADPLFLLSFAPLLQIAHHIPGRVRLKLGAGGTDGTAVGLGDIGRLLAALEASPGIGSVSFNPLARSGVITYDPAVIAPAVWQDLTGGIRSAGVMALAEAVGRQMSD